MASPSFFPDRSDSRAVEAQPSVGARDDGRRLRGRLARYVGGVGGGHSGRRHEELTPEEVELAGFLGGFDPGCIGMASHYGVCISFSFLFRVGEEHLEVVNKLGTWLEKE